MPQSFTNFLAKAGFLLGLVFYLLPLQDAAAVNAEKDVNNGAVDLGASASYTPVGVPTATSDVTFKGATTYSPTAFTIGSGVNLSIGTLNDLDSTQSLSIQRVTTASTAATLTLNGGGDTVSGSNTADLIYLTANANLTIQNSSNAKPLNVVLATTGNLDTGTGANLKILSDISGSGFTKTGAGTLQLGGNNTYSGTTISAGTVQLLSGGTVGSDTAGLTINGGSLDLGGTAQTVGALNGTGGSVTNSGAAATFTVGNGNATGSYAGSITNGAGTVALIKTGTGSETLTGASTYSGGTIINGGTLFADNATNSTGSGTVTVNSTGTLGGNGKIVGGVSIGAGATLSPGATASSIGTLTTGALTLQSGVGAAGATSIFDVGSSTIYDKLISTAALNLGGTLNVNVASGQTFNAGDTLTLFSGTSENGTFNGIADNQVVFYNGYAFTADYTATGFNLVAVPEPSTWFAAALSLAAIGFTQRRRFLRLAKRAG